MAKQAAGMMDQVETEYFQLKGGMDQMSPALTLAPGICRDAINFECNVLGGYARVAGFERFDGRPSPSAQSYWVLRAVIGNTLNVNDMIVGATSGATASVAYVDFASEPGTSVIVITKLVGSFSAGGEGLLVGGVAKSHSLVAEQRNGAATTKLDAQYTKYAGDVYRNDILVVPGTGSVLGVWLYNDVVYAFRNKADGSQALMYKSSPAGWTLVTTPSLAPGGKYEFRTENFGGLASMKKMYGVDGVNKAFQFDGTTFTQITTGMAHDAPNHLEIHKNYLFLAFDASLQYSAVGDPLTWSVVVGAGEIALGDHINSLVSFIGSASGSTIASSTDALVIHTNSKTLVLYGSSNADFSLSKQSSTAGGVEQSVQVLDRPYYLSDQGIVNLSTTQAFGNFTSSSLSQTMQDFMNQERSRVASSCIVRGKSQYRLYFNDGYGLHMSFLNNKVIGLMPVQLGIALRCIVSEKNSLNTEQIFAGSDLGYVYQMEKGPNFDGQPIIGYLYLAFASFKSPRTRKRFRRVVIETEGNGYMEYAVDADLGWASTEISPSPAQTVLTQLLESTWDNATWDQFFWDGVNEAPNEVPLDGTAENIGLKIFTQGDSFEPFNMNSVIFHYSMRRKLR